VRQTNVYNNLYAQIVNEIDNPAFEDSVIERIVEIGDQCFTCGGNIEGGNKCFPNRCPDFDQKLQSAKTNCYTCLNPGHSYTGNVKPVAKESVPTEERYTNYFISKLLRSRPGL
jgi:hypothetical protein